MKNEEIHMVYLDIKNQKDKSNINNLLRDMNLEWEEVRSKKNLRKNQIVITDNNLNQVKDYHKVSSNVIVYNKSKDSLTNEIYYQKGTYTFTILDELETILKIIKENNRRKKQNYQIVGIFLMGILGFLMISTSYKAIKNTYSQGESTKPVEIQEDSIKKENIVFFGDSITAMYQLEDYYGDLPVVNSGVTGNTTEDLLKDMEERVYVYNPTKVFLLIGTNDISSTDLTNSEIVSNIKEIVNRIHHNRKNATVYVESILPIRNTVNTPTDILHKRENSRIISLNRMIQEMCQKEEIEYIDLYKSLLAEDGELNMKYSMEGVHMNQEGYKVITKELKKYI